MRPRISKSDYDFAGVLHIRPVCELKRSRKCVYSVIYAFRSSIEGNLLGNRRMGCETIVGIALQLLPSKVVRVDIIKDDQPH